MAAVQSPGRGLRRFDEHAAKATKLVEAFSGLETGMAPSNALAALERGAPYMDVPLRLVSMIDLLFAGRSHRIGRVADVLSSGRRTTCSRRSWA